MDIALFDFALASVLMGIGIGTDVALATVARAQQLKGTRVALIWVVGVSATHTLFPMLGYLTTYFGVQYLPTFTPYIGLIAFICIFWYLMNEFLCLFTDRESSENQTLLVTLGLILAVSWDALWSGPAKSAQVIGWPEMMVWASFILVGVAVACLAMASLVFSKILQGRLNQDPSIQQSLLWLQYSVIGYFGWLALLRYTLALAWPWYQILALSALLTAGVMIIGYSKTNDITPAER